MYNLEMLIESEVYCYKFEKRKNKEEHIFNIANYFFSTNNSGSNVSFYKKGR